MIKVVAFDLVGVLVNEKDIELSEIEEKLERMFGPNINDADYLIEARKIIEKDSIIMNITETLIDKLYKVKDREIFKKVKEIYGHIDILINNAGISSKYTVAIGLYKMLDKSLINSYFTQFCAGGVLVSIPISILFMIMQKFYVEGITGGAVKG